jgi:hypothetical protein
MVRGAQIELSVSAGRAHYRLLKGREAEFLHDGQRQWLSSEQPELTLPLRAPLAQPTTPPVLPPLAPSAAA